MIVEFHYTTALILFLLPCAIQDWRHHQISNWLTLPAFVVGWIAAFYLNSVALTASIFVGCYVAWLMKGVGAADGKVATLVAALAPASLAITGFLLGLTFLLLRLGGHRNARLPTIVWLWLGCLLHAILLSASLQTGQSWYTDLVITLPQLLGMVVGWCAMVYLVMVLLDLFSPKLLLSNGRDSQS